MTRRKYIPVLFLLLVAALTSLSSFAGTQGPVVKSAVAISKKSSLPGKVFSGDDLFSTPFFLVSKNRPGSAKTGGNNNPLPVKGIKSSDLLLTSTYVHRKGPFDGPYKDYLFHIYPSHNFW